jgi:hypothetical protein
LCRLPSFVFFLVAFSSLHISFLVAYSRIFSCFYSPISFVSLKFYVFPSLFIVLLLSFRVSVCRLLFIFFLSFRNLSCRFFSLMIRKTTKPILCTRYDVTSAYLLCDLLTWFEDGKIVSVIFQNEQ